jgi:hypothetical protein
VGVSVRCSSFSPQLSHVLVKKKGTKKFIKFSNTFAERVRYTINIVHGNEIIRN